MKTAQAAVVGGGRGSNNWPCIASQRIDRTITAYNPIVMTAGDSLCAVSHQTKLSHDGKTMAISI